MIRKMQVLSFILIAFFFAGCTTHTMQETEYTPSGQVSYKKKTIDDEVISELRRVFEDTRLEGEGIFENDNEGLARRAATQLAVNELASQVQTMTKSETKIWNNDKVRDVVQNKVHALVNDYRISSAGYDPGTNKYRVTVSLTGERLVREIQQRIQ
ncbi:MAG: hypothetical protein U5L00_17980 [Desulfovermiculus sp.]|nr:hypothetical protein [Desulfovermiculus sp.]